MRRIFAWKVVHPTDNDRLAALLEQMMLRSGALRWEVRRGDPTGDAWHGMLTMDFATADELARFHDGEDHRAVVGQIVGRLGDRAIMEIDTSGVAASDGAVR